MREAIDCSTTHLTEVKTILSVRSGRATYLCLKGGTYTDFYAVLNEKVYTTPPSVLCSIASCFYYRHNVKVVDTFHHYLCRRPKAAEWGFYETLSNIGKLQPQLE